MKLWRIYCNRPDLFGPIAFNEGLNVIYAKVKKPKDRDQDSHNLGKTLLIELIDFMLLKTLKKGHFLKDQSKRFRDFVFYLEVKTNQGEFVTIRRAPIKASKIWLICRDQSLANVDDLEPEHWDHVDLPIKKAKTLLSQVLNLNAIDTRDYRKGVGYFLRTQNDYRDVFQLLRFDKGKDRDWKPFMAALLGMRHLAIDEKYHLDEQLKTKNTIRDELQKSFATDVDEQGRLTSMIDIRKSEVSEARKQIERFNFYINDLDLNRELVEEVEQEIAALNERLYVVEFELSKVAEALETKTSFDLNRVRRLFEEAELYFPDQLHKSYEQLIEFQQKMTSERNTNLSAQYAQLYEEGDQLRSSLEELNIKREEILSILQDTDTFNKYRGLQRTLTQKEADIARLEGKLENVNYLAAIDQQIEDLEGKIREQIAIIKTQIQEPNEVFSRVRLEFNRIIRHIFNLNGFVYVDINKKGNLEFKASLLGVDDQETSEDKGTSYKQLLCSAFDMALLLAYKDQSFYRFVYHDGVFERLDHRKKQRLLEELHSLCEDHGLQYIFTIIDADMPRDAEDRRIEFKDFEIVLTLHDDSNDGRLFRMDVF